MRHAEYQWGIALLFQHAEAGKLEEELFVSRVLEADVGLGVLACTLYLEYLADAEALVLNELSRGELCHTGSSARGVGRDETTGG